MKNFELLPADVAFDLTERGFRKEESYTPINCGSMISLHVKERKDVLVRSEGSIANFSEYIIGRVYMDENYDEEPILVASVYYHSFSECGAWYGDGETVKQMYIPVEKLADFFREHGVRTKKEWEERRAQLRARMLAKRDAK